ncbi:hypothetical protein TPHA_0A04800 [Tetrapisispora phaffii CBS 4417]|uniref:Dolichyl-phosphate-mannose--protein mannosyltransferase n=1 Tax=Tetrapisispora phaffii (strain ATCC 24235 / CBS 4417 / NBRC 1672 / NRRL Y-8282 / UCD 70-5) TaxID=1071381 RepID=G8BNS7_TETPH|nr:hypothetical protein TPHA_0A04800 [Tetrapisispora phaffii CBS 4417]CCE61555.1 hypothetical protein TPHA_0A04800 [Tetrapisispora phaffii CBS 4417]
MESTTSGFDEHQNLSDLSKRNNKDNVQEDVVDQIDDNKTQINEKKNVCAKNHLGFGNILVKIEPILGPLLITILSFVVRFYKIDRNKNVVWDEAHFGKFGSYYIKHEFYHDVHPPLGKMLIALSEWLAGFDGDFDFESNTAYPAGVDFKFMRQFNATFGALCAPVTYYTAKWMGFNILTVYLVSIMVTLELSYIALSKFILLDSMLLFFTMTTFSCMVKIYNLRNKPFTPQWSIWMLLTGINIGCVCSVKWVGLFITVIVGLYTIVELWALSCDATLSRKKYYKHWLIRIIDLIIIPFLVYMNCFKVHFSLLYKSGTGDASTNTLFQVNLEGTQIENSPRTVMFGSDVTIRSHGLSPNLLHSHIQTYPVGSLQNQITGYGFSDENNKWTFKFAREDGIFFDSNNKTVNGELIAVKDGDTVRLNHKSTMRNLHSHYVASHVSQGNFEVSGYGTDEGGDAKDNWIIEIVQQLKSNNPDFHQEDSENIHPVSTFFRLRHQELGCYLASTGFSYPGWGFKQSEIVCKNSWSKRDKSTWWNVEDHWNDMLEIEDDYVPPKSKFWTDFILINFAMAASNNALIPDDDKYDNLASEPWEWPTLHIGLRMCTWAHDVYRYYLIGSPFNTWLSTASLFVCIIILAYTLYEWRRQKIHLNENNIWKLSIQFVFPFIAWVTHFVPFLIMGRVTYVHHYLPALYFSMLVFASTVDYLLSGSKTYIKYPSYLILFGSCIYIYIIFAPLCQGMTGFNNEDLKKISWLSSWDFNF